MLLTESTNHVASNNSGRSENEQMNAKGKKTILVDRKNWLTYLFWSMVNMILIAVRFKSYQVIGRENIPRTGPFLLVANHTSRWDGLLVYKAIGRPANFMVSPNELVGMQGQVLLSMGAFPADPRAAIVEHARAQMQKGEGVVIFPEGNVFCDGVTHQFKNGASRVALSCAAAGLNIPLVPAAINYASDRKVAQIVLGEPIDLQTYLDQYEADQLPALRNLSQRMHREVCHLRETLGNIGDRLALYGDNARHSWARLVKTLSEQATQPIELSVNQNNAVNMARHQIAS